VTFTGRVGSILRVTSWEEELTRTHSKEEKREREKTTTNELGNSTKENG
jgi:hypothetical protein